MALRITTVRMALRIATDFSSSGYSLILNAQELELNTQVGAELQQSDSKYPFKKKKNCGLECDSLVSADMDIGHIKMRTKNKHTFLMEKKKRTKADKKLILSKSTSISTTKKTRSPHNRSFKKLEQIGRLFRAAKQMVDTGP